MNNNDIPVWEKYTLTIEEASKYFRIGENKLRRLAEENKDAGWLIMNGNRIQIKRRQFEKVIDKLDEIRVSRRSERAYDLYVGHKYLYLCYEEKAGKGAA